MMGMVTATWSTIGSARGARFLGGMQFPEHVALTAVVWVEVCRDCLLLLYE